MTVPQDTGELLHHVGELIGSERLNEAADVLRAASEREPANAIVLVTLGDVLARLGRTIPARRYYQRALERDAGDCVARVQLARLLAHQGDAAQAIEHYRQAITWRADTAPAYIELAALLAERGDQAGAIEMLSRLAERQPDTTDAPIALGDMLMNAGRCSEAEACFRKALTVSPQNAEFLVRLGASLREQDRFEEARIAFSEALRVAPRFAEAARPLADLHWKLGQREQALSVLQEFLAQSPFDFGVQHDLARRLDRMGRHGEARSHYESALALAPHSEEVITALGLHELRDGDQTRGWLGAWLAARRDLAADKPAVAAAFDVELPRDLSGKTVLLLAEGGLGNELFFLRYVPHLKARGAQVLYRASPETYLLLRQRLTGLEGVIGSREALPPCDYTLLVSALPWVLWRADFAPLADGQRVASVKRRQHRPRSTPVARRVFWPELPARLRLEPNAARLKFWRERLAEMGAAPYTAITWRAGALPAPDPLRHTGAAAPMEAPIDALGKILGGCPGTLFSIQREPGPGEADRLSASAGRTVHDVSRANNDLEDVLALLALADDYVCVSNTHTDLRGCVGNTAKVLVPWPPHWRWMAWGAESPWFPGFKVYRQQPDGNWTRALTQLARDLASERNA